MKFLLVLTIASMAAAAPQRLRPTIFEGSFKVIGGTDANIADYPMQASLRFSGSHTCGCALLSGHACLTAAHCTHNRVAVGFSVLAGVSDRTDTSSANNQLNSISTYVNHAGYTGSNGFENDIAIVKFPVLTFHTSSTVQWASIPTGAVDQFTGDQCVITGWGRTGPPNTLPMVLQQGDVTIISRSQCQADMSAVNGAVIHASHICIWGGGSTGACNGDSGGPLHCKNMQVGISSWVISSNGNCLTSYPAVYTRTSSFLSWINSNDGAA